MLLWGRDLATTYPHPSRVAPAWRPGGNPSCAAAGPPSPLPPPSPSPVVMAGRSLVAAGGGGDLSSPRAVVSARVEAAGPGCGAWRRVQQRGDAPAQLCIDDVGGVTDGAVVELAWAQYGGSAAPISACSGRVGRGRRGPWATASPMRRRCGGLRWMDEPVRGDGWGQLWRQFVGGCFVVRTGSATVDSAQRPAWR